MKGICPECGRLVAGVKERLRFDAYREGDGLYHVVCCLRCDNEYERAQEYRNEVVEEYWADQGIYE